MRARRIAVPELARASHSLTAHDYEDAFEIAAPAADSLSAERWARAVFEDSGALAPFLYLAWSLYCRLQLAARDSPQAVLGWSVADATPEAVVLDAQSSAVHAQLVIWTTPTTLSLSTIVQYKDLGGRLLFSSISAIHRQLVPYLLARAVNATERRGGRSTVPQAARSPDRRSAS